MTSLNTNVVNGAINHSNVMRGFGCPDFIKSATVFGEQGTALSLLVMAFSQKAWDSLPADLQQLFIDAAASLRDNQGAWDNGANMGNIAAIAEAGGTVTSLTNDEIQVWRDAFADTLAKYIQSLNDGGSNRRAKDIRCGAGEDCVLLVKLRGF